VKASLTSRQYRKKNINNEAYDVKLHRVPL